MNLSRLATPFVLSCACLTWARSAQAQPTATAGDKLRVLIVDGYDPYHDGRVLTPLMKQMLEQSGRFTVGVATAVTEEEASEFRPRFADYDVVVNAYVGRDWPAETKQAFADYVAGGGGFVCVHAGNNSFGDWPEYNRITGVGGWGGRDERSGPYVYYNDDGELVRDESPGPGGHHGPQHEFQVRVRDAEHPITRGLPEQWMHTQDELYDSLRGPAEEMQVLATAYSAPDQEGTGRHEPMLLTIGYGQGRTFHTIMGHADYSMKCVGFTTTFLRGTEWAATGEVTIGVQDEFPTPDDSLGRP